MLHIYFATQRTVWQRFPTKIQKRWRYPKRSVNRSIVSESELVQVQVPLLMIIPEKGHNHSFQYSIDPLSGICLGMIHRISGMKNTQALARLLNHAVRELGAIVRMDNFRGTPTRPGLQTVV